ncbi:hypothetical protein [cf. Phormidesmis sp. LEGE 11477]|nr:hypothetical protein [cf. Phormidesmis sp. LEGE 11477]
MTALRLDAIASDHLYLLACTEAKAKIREVDTKTTKNHQIQWIL